MTVEVDTALWEKIRHADMRAGDRILAVRHSTDSRYPSGSVEGVVADNANPHIAGWYVSGTGIYDLILYRARPPFEVPTNLGAVIEAQEKGTGEKVVMHLTDPTDEEGLYWGTRDGSWFSPHDIMEDFKNQIVLSEGVVVP